MVYRMDMPMHGCGSGQKEDRCRQIRPNRASAPLMDFFGWLVRSRRAFKRVGAAPGAPSMAAEGMDGSDGRADGIPGGGRGLSAEIGSGRPTKY